ncbi:hypothetical protein [Streptomyces sp. NPDC051452]|uniref:hypothetical protein n=1 Tax=Streptomyces sp. NPDC051452 TaxID=3365654 RepID=UPI0037AE7910
MRNYNRTDGIAGQRHRRGDDGDYRISDGIALYKVKRAAPLTTVITPEEVAKGAKVTVTGKLSRANWEEHLTEGGGRRRAQPEVAGERHRGSPPRPRRIRWAA